MAKLSHMSDSEGLVQSMLQRLRLQEERSEQASTTSEDLTNTTIQEVDTLANAASDNRRAPHTKWPGLSPVFKGSPKSFGLRKGPTGQKDNISFSGINGEFPRWERKQLRFSLVSSLIAEKEKTVGTHAYPAGETEIGLGSPKIQIQTNAEAQEIDGTKCDEISAQLTQDPVKPVNTFIDSPIWESITTEDTASSSTDSLSRNSQPVDQVFKSKTSNNVRKNKRKWAETKTTKRLTQKIKDKWRDRHPSVEKQHSQNGEKFGEKEHQLNTDKQVSSHKSSEVKENAVLPPPIREAGTEVTPRPQGYDSISLSGFCMGFSTSLMDEICTGPEWTRFFASSNSPDCPDDQSTSSAAAEQGESMTSQNAIGLPESMQENDATEAKVPGIDEITPNDDQSVDMESSENSVTQLASEQVSHNQQAMVEVISDQGSTELNHNESQITINSLGPSNMDTVSDDQSEAESMSGTDDIKDEQTHMTEPDLSQTSRVYMNPHQTEITSPNLDEATAGEIHPHQIQMILPALTETNTIDMSPQLPPPTHTDDQSVYVTEESQITDPTLTQPDTSEMMNPYLTETTQTEDQSETEDITPDQSSQTTEPTNNSSLGEGDIKVPQFLPLLDFSYLKAGDRGKNSSTHEKKRRALQSEERETFIDEDDDGSVLAKSHRKAPLSPPPFPPPFPPSQPVAQRSISLNSDSSLSEIVPKKRRLDSTPRRVRFAEEVVMLPSYIQPEVEDWPEPEGIEEDTDELEDPDDLDETTETEEISKSKEASEKTSEAQLSLYNWILGITKKNKRKAQI